MTTHLLSTRIFVTTLCLKNVKILGPAKNVAFLFTLSVKNTREEKHVEENSRERSY